MVKHKNTKSQKYKNVKIQNTLICESMPQLASDRTIVTLMSKRRIDDFRRRKNPTTFNKYLNK